MEVGSSSVSRTYRVSKNTHGILRWHTTDNLRWRGCTFECHLDRSRSLYLPAHTLGHLSPKIVCTPLARILSLPCRGLVLAWPGAYKGWEGKSPPPQYVGCFSRGRWAREGWEKLRAIYGFSIAKVTVDILARWQGEEPDRLPYLWPKGTALGFPWLLERQPFGEVPVFPGGMGRAAQDTWIPLLPASSSLCGEGWRNSRIWWVSQPANVTSYTRWKLRAWSLEKWDGGPVRGERKDANSIEEKFFSSFPIPASSVNTLGPNSLPIRTWGMGFCHLRLTWDLPCWFSWERTDKHTVTGLCSSPSMALFIPHCVFYPRAFYAQFTCKWHPRTL